GREATKRAMTKVQYWIGVASREHVRLGVKGGFAQFSHGKLAPARRLSQGDWIIYYSPKLKFGEAEPCQKFVAIGRAIDREPFRSNSFRDSSLGGGRFAMSERPRPTSTRSSNGCRSSRTRLNGAQRFASASSKSISRTSARSRSECGRVRLADVLVFNTAALPRRERPQPLPDRL